MKRYIQRFIFHANRILNKPMTIVLVLVFLFIYFAIGNVQFQKDNRQLIEATKRSANNTEKIVTKQDETLQAIKDLATDNKLTAQQLGDTIICMLQVPVSQRTPNTKEDCQKKAVSVSQPSSETNSGTYPSANNQNTFQNTPSNNNKNQGTAPPNPSIYSRITDGIQDFCGRIFVLNRIC
jgi:hypothetical protein